MISLSKKSSFFCYQFWSLSDFFVFLQNCLVRYVKPPIIVQREINGKYNLEKLFALNNFVFWAEKKTWTFSKTVGHDSQNRSLHMQMKTSRNFSGSKNICIKVFGHWTEASDFLRNVLLRVAKVAFQVSSATLWEKTDKTKRYFLWLV